MKQFLIDTSDSILNIDGEWRDNKKKAAVKLYNHHVYFVGIRCGRKEILDCTIFYLTPQGDNGVHIIGTSEGENSYEFQESSVRVRHMSISVDQADDGKIICKDYETWGTIPLQ